MILRWGIAGAGKISHDFVVAVQSLPLNEHVVLAVAARELSRAKEFAAFHEIEKAYDDYLKLAKDKNIDIVYVGTIHPTHFDIAMMMLSHGKHVLCEKPLTMNLKQTTELITYAKSKKLFLMEAVWSRCFPIYDWLGQQLANNIIGDIHQVIVSFGFSGMLVDRLTKKALGGGTILDLGIYCLQFVCLIYGNEMPENIQVTGFLNEDGIDISMSATLTYKGNRTATIMTHGMVALPNTAYVCGIKGMIEIPQFWAPTTMTVKDKKMESPVLETKHPTNFINSAGLLYEAKEVRDCIMQGLIESPKISHETSLLLARLEDELRKQLGVIYPQD